MTEVVDTLKQFKYRQKWLKTMLIKLLCSKLGQQISQKSIEFKTP